MKTRARRITPFLLLSCLFPIFLGCSHIADYLSIAKNRGLSKQYLQALDTWTRKETVYSEFETQVSVSATYQGKDFRKAYLDEYSRLYNLTPAEKEKQEAFRQESNSTSREFFLYAYLPEKSDNDFSKPNSLWKISMIDAQGKRVDPLEVRKIEKVTPLIEVFYPYVHKYYGYCYLLRFPAATGGAPDRPLQLLLTGVLGKATLLWK